MIKVKLKPEQGIKVKLTPSQSHEVNLKTVYLYDPDWIPEIDKAVADAKESADNAKVSEQNAAQSASDADADATNAAESATIAYNSEQNAIAQANKATEEANAAAESAYQAQTSALAAYEYASNAEADAQNALETLGHVLVAETNATNAANTATEQAGIATQKATEAGTHATNAGVSATNAKTSEDNAKNYELGAKGYSETATQEANASAESAYQSQQSALASAQYASDAESDAQNALETLGHVLESETISTNAANTATQKAQDAAESAVDAQESAEEAQRIKDSLGNVYVFKGTVATFSDLPTNASVGDVYDVLDTGENYAWTGTEWDDIGGTVDLSAYAKTTYVDGREQAIREDYMQADSELQTQINGQATAITEAQGDIVDLQNNKQGVISDLDTIRFGAGKGATAVQPSDLSTVATSGSYNDLTNKPTIPSATSQLTNDSDYTTKNYVDTTEQEIIENYMQADTDLQTQITGLSGTVATNQTDIVNLKAQKYGADLSYADSQLQLLDQDGNALGSPVEISVDTSNAANIDLSNLSAVGQEILDNKLNKQMISNCITEIPQDIKLELNDGTVTLKAGSKIYVPNGKNSDGTLKFDEVVVENDISTTGTTNRTTVLFLTPSGNTLDRYNITYCQSGSTYTTDKTYIMWYDTTNNLVKKSSNSGSSWTVGESFPIAVCTETSSGFTSIKQVFNGFGYIGSTVFALPGVKFLVPNGRNPDGTLQNIECTLTKNTTSTIGTDFKNRPFQPIWFALNAETVAPKGFTFSFDNYSNTEYDLVYDAELNKHFYRSTGNYEEISGCLVGFGNIDANSKFIALDSKQSFHALDFSDKLTIVGWGRQFTVVNKAVASGNAGIAGTYYIGFTDSNVKIGVFSAAIQLTGSGFSAMEIASDVLPGGVTVCGTNNSFKSVGCITIPFKRTITISFPSTGGGVGSGTTVHFEGYM